MTSFVRLCKVHVVPPSVVFSNVMAVVTGLWIRFLAMFPNSAGLNSARKEPPHVTSASLTALNVPLRQRYVVGTPVSKVILARFTLLLSLESAIRGLSPVAIVTSEGTFGPFASRLVLTSFSLGYLVSEGVLPHAVTLSAVGCFVESRRLNTSPSSSTILFSSCSAITMPSRTSW